MATAVITMDKNGSDYLRSLYKKQRLTQAEASKRLGVSEDVFSNYVRGLTNPPQYVMEQARLLWDASAREAAFGKLPQRPPIPYNTDQYSTLPGVQVPSFLCAEGRFVTSPQEVPEQLTGLVVPGRDLLVVDPKSAMRAGRLIVGANSDGITYLDRAPAPLEAQTLRLVGVVVGILRDVGKDAGLVIWDETGVVV